MGSRKMVLMTSLQGKNEDAHKKMDLWTQWGKERV